jgi:hypothetical protein
MKLSIQDVKGIANSRFGKMKTKTYVSVLLWVSVAFLLLACGFGFGDMWTQENTVTAYQIESSGMLTVGNEHIMLDGKYLTPESPTNNNDSPYEIPFLIFLIGFSITFICGFFAMIEEGDKYKANFVQHYVDTGELLEK